MRIDFKFEIGDKVKIIDASCRGRVLSLWVTDHGKKYEVRFIINGNVKEVFFFEDEIEKDSKDA